MLCDSVYLCDLNGGEDGTHFTGTFEGFNGHGFATGVQKLPLRGDSPGRRKPLCLPTGDQMMWDKTTSCFIMCHALSYILQIH